MNRSGIFLTRYLEQLPQPLSPHIAHFSYAPLSQLLPLSAALIHHGGIGTCSQALRAGIPQLIQPYAFDQFDNGKRINRLGVGTTLSKKWFRGRFILERLDFLLSSFVVQAACNEARDYLVTSPSLNDTCTVIEKKFL